METSLQINCYIRKHHADPIHSYKDWNCMVHIYVPVNPKYNVGDICRITGEGYRYPSYDQMAFALSKKFDLNYDYWKGEKYILGETRFGTCAGKLNDKVEIIGYAIHGNKNTIVYAVKPDYTHKWIIIGEDGLELIEYKPFLEEMDFLL